MTTEFINNFLVFDLWRTLQQFRVGNFEAGTAIDWFHKDSKFWPRKTSQLEFNEYARKKLAERVGFTRKQATAWGTFDKLLDPRKYERVSFQDIVAASTTLCPTEEMPYDVVENGETAFVDLSRRSDHPKILTIDSDFLPTLKQLYPWERQRDEVIKHIPIGSTTRELNLVILASLRQFPDSDADAVEFRNANKLDWRGSNLRSRKSVEENQWAPCIHWGGTRLCEACMSAGVNPADMIHAREMFEQHRAFVRQRIHRESAKWTGGRGLTDFAEVESRVWLAVARRIHGYKPRVNPETGEPMPLAWLTAVVHSVLADYFKYEFAGMRDARLTSQFSEEAPDGSLVENNSSISLPN